MASATTEMFGTLALASTLLLYLTEIPLLKSLTLKRSSEGIQFSAILMNLVNNICSLAYGILSSTEVMKITNGIGTLLHLTMLVAFITVSRQRSSPLAMSVGAAAFIGGLKVYLQQIPEDERLDSLGLISTGVCFLAFTTPGFAVMEAWQSKNPALISIPVTWGSLICSCCWGVYGAMLNNVYIIAPNAPGVLISVAGLAVGLKQKTD